MNTYLVDMGDKSVEIRADWIETTGMGDTIFMVGGPDGEQVAVVRSHQYCLISKITREG